MSKVKRSKKAKQTTAGKIFKKVIKYWLPIVVWAIIIFWFSSLPLGRSSRIYWKDFVVKKSAHIFEYAVLTTLLYRALKQSSVEKKEAGVYAVILAVLYGVSDETHQLFTPGREPTIRDVIFDTIGSVLAIYGIWRLLPKAPEKLKTRAEKLQLT